ncbi:MAG TPA: TMEM175 family protein [Candidatus Angelobacter sp.]|nr:TMEM175 family protein [Candidatus Angelobacter sp.]
MNTPTVSPRKLIHSLLLSKGRMEALTDGIFAIAMTLLVLELKVPEMPKSAGASELLRRIGEQGPEFLSFVISFMYCGVLWLMHHLAMHFVRHLQIALVWLNLVFLMSISVMPYSCGLLGHFVHNRAAQEIYYGNMFLAAALLALQWLVAKKKKLLNEDDPRTARALAQQIIFFPTAVGMAMAATLFSPTAGSYAFLIALVALRLWQKKKFSEPAPTPASPSS